MERKWRGK